MFYLKLLVIIKNNFLIIFEHVNFVSNFVCTYIYLYKHIQIFYTQTAAHRNNLKRGGKFKRFGFK